MTITRCLPAVVLAAATAGPVAAQNMPRYSQPGQMSGLIPSVAPTGGGGDEMSSLPGRPYVGESGVERLTKAQQPPTAPDRSNGQPQSGPRELPPGSVASPYYTDGPGCCGPMGANGLIAYNVYTVIGPTIPFGSGVFTDRLNVGLMVGGGGRTLLFDRTGDAAWAIDLGLTYQHNRGKLAHPIDLFVRVPPQQDITGAVQAQPDAFISTRIRGLHRTSFNFALGREWYLNGPGTPGAMPGWNFHFGVDLGGRWGTSHTDLLREDSNDFYFRRQGVFHAFTAAAHCGWDVPFGGWVWFGGIRAEYGYTWMNIAPPVKSDVQEINVLFQTGIRF